MRQLDGTHSPETWLFHPQLLPHAHARPTTHRTKHTQRFNHSLAARARAHRNRPTSQAPRHQGMALRLSSFLARPKQAAAARLATAATATGRRGLAGGSAQLNDRVRLLSCMCCVVVTDNVKRRLGRHDRGRGTAHQPTTHQHMHRTPSSSPSRAPPSASSRAGSRRSRPRSWARRQSRRPSTARVRSFFLEGMMAWLVGGCVLGFIRWVLPPPLVGPADAHAPLLSPQRPYLCIDLSLATQASSRRRCRRC